MKDNNKKQKRITAEKLRAVIARVLLVVVACAGIAYAADTDSGANVDNRKLQNGSFEEGQTWRESTK